MSTEQPERPRPGGPAAASPPPLPCYAVTPRERALSGPAYVGLAARCAWGVHVAYVVPPS